MNDSIFIRVREATNSTKEHLLNLMQIVSIRHIDTSQSEFKMTNGDSLVVRCDYAKVLARLAPNQDHI